MAGLWLRAKPKNFCYYPPPPPTESARLTAIPENVWYYPPPPTESARLTAIPENFCYYPPPPTESGRPPEITENWPPPKKKSWLRRCCLTPFVTVKNDEVFRPHFTHSVCCRYKWTSNRTTTNGTFLSISFLKSDQCSTLSKAFNASKKHV